MYAVVVWCLARLTCALQRNISLHSTGSFNVTLSSWSTTVAVSVTHDTGKEEQMTVVNVGCLWSHTTSSSLFVLHIFISVRSKSVNETPVKDIRG